MSEFFFTLNYRTNLAKQYLFPHPDSKKYEKFYTLTYLKLIISDENLFFQHFQK